MILVTGATGFLGQHVVRALLGAGYDLRLLVRNAASRSLDYGKLVETVDGDVTEVDSLARAMQGIDTVIHLAAVVSYWPKKRPLLYRVNVEGTANVVNMALEAGVKRLVHMSSIAALGHEPGDRPITEESPWMPGRENSYYSKTKYLAEMEVFRGIEEGLPAVMLNPAVVFGKTDRWSENTGKIFSVVHRGLRFFNRGLTGFVGADDVAQAVLLVLGEAPPAGERFILCAANLSQKEMLSKVARAIGKSAPTMPLPRWLTLSVGYISEGLAVLTGKEPLITRETMRSAVQRHYYDGSKITQMGLTYTPIDQVIAATGKAFLETV